MASQHSSDDEGKCKCTYGGISSSIRMINNNLENTLLLLTEGKDCTRQFCTENEEETARTKSGNVDFDAILNQFEQQPSSSQSTAALSFDDEENCFSFENMENRRLTCEQTKSEVVNGTDEGCLDDKQQCLLNTLSHIARNSILVQEHVRKALHSHQLLQKELLLVKRRHSVPSDLSSTSIYADIISDQSSLGPSGTQTSIHKQPELLDLSTPYSDNVRLYRTKLRLSPSFNNKPPKRLPADVTFLNSILPNGIWSQSGRRTKCNQNKTESSKRRRLKMDQEIT
ncbi:hypothetical protein T07_3947 [Trichinella nelsoni]|uniref:Uncharacterized protein n=1 Tax=Trichinella nelsoni TaxID=6336 RepID=A0A0V0SMD6_9BILA|nr:hypothetical protein T07_3947 [Trichinella nelsoni]